MIWLISIRHEPVRTVGISPGRPQAADQAQLDSALQALAAIPEVVECVGTAGPIDLLIRAVARDPEHFYRVGQLILACPGIRRTATSIVLREFIHYRMAPLLSRGRYD